MVNGSALVGIAATPPCFGALIDRFGWPFAFMIMGGVTAILALVWTVLASDGPKPLEEPEEIAVTPAAWHALLRHKSLMLLTLSYGAIGYFQYMFFYWMNYYFETVLKLSPERSHFYAAIPPLAMAVGMPLGGWLSDRIEHARGKAEQPQDRSRAGDVGRRGAAVCGRLRASAGLDRDLVFAGAGGRGNGRGTVMGHGHRAGRISGRVGRGASSTPAAMPAASWLPS